MELWYNAGFGKVLTCCDFDFGNNYLDLESNVVNMGKMYTTIPSRFKHGK